LKSLDLILVQMSPMLYCLKEV